MTSVFSASWGINGRIFLIIFKINQKVEESLLILQLNVNLSSKMNPRFLTLGTGVGHSPRLAGHHLGVQRDESDPNSMTSVFSLFNFRQLDCIHLFTCFMQQLKQSAVSSTLLEVDTTTWVLSA